MGIDLFKEIKRIQWQQTNFISMKNIFTSIGHVNFTYEMYFSITNSITEIETRIKI